MARLIVSKSGNKEREIPLARGPVAIGRSADNDLVLLDVSVSRQHARIEPAGETGYRIVDLGSGNGIVHEGERVSELELYPGCVVALGEYVLELDAPEASKRKAEAAPSSAGPRAKLVLIGGRERIATPLEGTTVVGRSERATLTIDDALISGEHFKVVATGDVYALVDLDSANGTFVNGVRVTERALKRGDQIRVAGITFYFAADGVEPEPGSVELIEPAQSASRPAPAPPAPAVRAPMPAVPEVKSEPRAKAKAKAKIGIGAGAGASAPGKPWILIGGSAAALLLLVVVVVLVARSRNGSTEREFQQVFQANLTAEARGRIEEYETSAADYESRGNLELALDQYRKILALDPTHQKALAETARMEEGLERDAAERAQRQREQSERLARVAELTEQADALVSDGDFDGARRLLDEARELAPGSSLVEGRIASSYVAEGNYQQRRSSTAARAAYQKALELDPSNAEARQGVARIDQSRRASQQQSNRVDELTETGLSQLRREEFRSAYQTFGEVLQLEPSNARAQEFREQASELLAQQVRPMYDEGVRLFNAGELAAAMAQFQRVRDLYPEHPDTRAFLSREMDRVRSEAVDRYKRAYIYEGLGRLREALVLYRESLALLPDPREEYHKKAAERISVIEPKLQ